MVPGRGVEIYSAFSPVMKINRKHPAKRGIIRTFSKASARRLRHFMLFMGKPEGWQECALNFSIPPPEVGNTRARELWRDFSNMVVKRGWGMVWRVEIQERKELHWHGIGITPPSIKHPTSHWTCLWWDAIRGLGHVKFDTPYKGKDGTYRNGILEASDRMEMPGAKKRAAVIETDGQSSAGAWLRYVQDHTSKTKQAQIPENIGRHWGVVGRKWFGTAEFMVDELPEKEHRMVLRWMQRLATPSRPDEGSPFGRSLGWRIKRGSRGRSTWFTRPETVARMIELARSNHKGVKA